MEWKDFAQLYTALFGSKEDYINCQLAQKNAAQAFSHQQQVALSTVAGDLAATGALISGGDDFTRAQIIYAALRDCPPSTAKVVLHAGNTSLTVAALYHAGLRANCFDGNLLVGETRAQLLVQITNEQNVDLVVFYNLAFDVLAALGRPICIEQLCGMDWLTLDWQQELLQIADRALALDLLTRYDHPMVALATKAVLELERMTRSSPRGCEASAGLLETFRRGEVLVVDVAANASLRQQVLETLLSLVHRGAPLCLVADQVLDTHHPLFGDGMRDVTCILSSRDITAVPQYTQYLGSAQNIILLQHLPGSAKQLSEYCFGEYEKHVQENSYAQSRAQGTLATPHYTSTQSIRTVKELRLSADKIADLPANLAVFVCAQYGEGVLLLEK